MQDIEGIAGQHAFPETNDVAVVIVLRRLDQNDMEFVDLFQHLTRRLPRACKLRARLL
jgi:hypothetical protein